MGVACTNDVEYLEPVTDSSFARGQVWSYQTRPGEEGSLLVVGAIDRAPRSGRVVHIKVTGVFFKAPQLPGGYAHEIMHLTLTEDALLESVTEQVDVPGVTLRGFDGGYANWLDAYEAGTTYVRKVPLAEALTALEESGLQ
jgi:hypothetical protein